MGQREIKFRAWNRIVNRMQVFTLQDIEKQKGSIQWQNIEIMQFTGLKDSKGNDIYEGDILQIMSDKIRDIKYYKVCFEDGSFVMYHKYGRWGLLSRIYDSDIKSFGEFEIIGNAFESNQLLAL